jgi:PIN domain nuclease of toxin-antitoxin system
MIFLDTHVVVWLYAKSLNLLSPKAKDEIDANDIIYISPLVILELEYLFEINRITVHGQEIIDYLMDKINLQVCEQSMLKVVQKAADLKWTRDPFDRIIVAQALVNEAGLLTKDKNILNNVKEALW